MQNGFEIGSHELCGKVPGNRLGRLTSLARRILDAPTAFVSFFSADHQNIESCSGLSGTPYEGSLANALGAMCRDVFESGRPLIVNTVRESERYRHLTGDVEHPLEAFAGVPIQDRSGQTIGALCAIDSRPRDWDAGDLASLGELATIGAAQVDLQIEIAAKHRLEEALFESEARHAALTSHIPIVFERRKTGPTRSRYTFFGMAKQDLADTYDVADIDAGPMRFIHPEDRERILNAIEETTAAETNLSLTFRIVLPTERGTRWIQSESIVRHDAHGVAIWDGLCFDITDLVAAHDAADAARQKAESLWVDANHELRTPLQGIIGYTELLKTETRPDLVRAHVHSIESASAGLLSIVNRLLDVARGESVAMAPVDLAALDIRSLTESCHGLVAPLALEKQLDMRVVIDTGVPQAVIADGPKIQHILVNLLNNAIKYTEAGSVVLYASFHETRLRFSVSDTGIGIPDHKIDLLFHRFSRIDPERRSMRGTGLGLAITKQLVESMDGTIGVIANPGGGSTFWFEVPAELEAAPAPIDQMPAKAIEASVRLESVRILIADDLDLNRQLISDMLSLEGYEIDCVSDGAEAVQAVKNQSYNLILMDMIMPGMDGLAATRAIRSLPAPACDVTIVALTAHSFREQLDSCIAAGMDATITKPMSLEALTSTVRRWTQGRSRAA